MQEIFFKIRWLCQLPLLSLRVMYWVSLLALPPLFIYNLKFDVMLTNNQNQISPAQLEAQNNLLDLFSKEKVFSTLSSLVLVKMAKNPDENLNFYIEDSYYLLLLKGIEYAAAQFKE